MPNKLKPILIVVVLVLFTGLLVVLFSSRGAPLGLTQAIDTKTYTLNIPADWRAIQLDEEGYTMRFVNRDGKARVSIDVAELVSNKTSLESLANSSIEELKEVSDGFALSEAIEAKVAGTNATKFTYLDSSPGFSTKNTQVMFYHKGLVFTVTYTARAEGDYDNHLGEFNTFTQSLAVKL